MFRLDCACDFCDLYAICHTQKIVDPGKMKQGLRSDLIAKIYSSYITRFIDLSEFGLMTICHLAVLSSDQKYSTFSFDSGCLRLYRIYKRINADNTVQHATGKNTPV